MRAGFWAGLVAGAITIVAIYLGLFTAGIPAVALALWDRWLRLVPMPLFSLLIVRLKFAAKPAAFWGMLVALALLLAIIGALVARWSPPSPGQGRLRRIPQHRPVRGLLTRGLAAWAAVSGLLWLLTSRPAAGYLSARLSAEGVANGTGLVVVTAIAGYGILFAAAFLLMLRLIPSTVLPRSEAASGVSRREFLSRAVLVLVAAAAGTAAAHWVQTATRRAVATAQSLFGRVKGLPPEITPNDQFYVVSKNPPGFDPVVDVSKWRLDVAGLVGKPLRLTYEDLRTLPAIEQFQTLECISNEVGSDLISNAKWRGVRLRDVLMRAGGPAPTAVKVSFRCADGYSESIPIDDAMNPTTLLAYEMNGEPLPSAHGFPIRLLVPGLFGMKNPKWITKIEVVDFDFQGYWEASGWSDEAVVKTMSKFTTTFRSEKLGDIGLGGLAYAGDRVIKEVEYSTDGGTTWQKVEVKPALGPFTWVLWAAIWKPTAPGEYTLKVRAKDGLGVLQAARQAPTLPDGASGYHTFRVRIRK